MFTVLKDINKMIQQIGTVKYKNLTSIQRFSSMFFMKDYPE